MNEFFSGSRLCSYSVAQSCLTLWDPMVWSTSGFPIFHYLLEFAQTHVHWINDAVQPAHSVTSFFTCPQSFPASGSFPMSWVFASGGQSIGVSASASVLSMNIQSWFPLGLTDLISLLSKGPSRVSTLAPQFKSISSSVLSLLYGPTLTPVCYYLKKHSFDYMDLCLYLLYCALFPVLRYPGN